jgi:inosose dehydratase
MANRQTRRRFLQSAAAGAAISLTQRPVKAAAAKQPSGFGATAKAAFKLGMASYTFRAFPLEQTIAMTKRLDLKYIALKSMHLPLESSDEQIAKIVAKVREAGLELYGGGVIYMNTADEINRAFDYAKAAGMKVIIGAPKHDLLGLVDEKVKQFDIKVAIHNHGPDDPLYPTPESVYEKVKDLDKRIGLCIDVGHAQRSGIDPSGPAEKFADRLIDIHIKDVDAATAEGKTIEMGRGVIDVPKLLRTLVKINYAGVAAFEFEKDERDTLPGVAESVGFTRGVLAAL